MGLILQSQLERALVKTKDYIDKKTGETSEICYLSDYGIPSYLALYSFNDKKFYLKDTSKIPKLVNTVISNPNKIYVLPYTETGQGYISSLKVSSPAPNAAVFTFFANDNGVETEYSITVISGQPYITVSKQPYQKILKSGINIKTINGESVLGEGNIVLEGGGGGVAGGGIYEIKYDLLNSNPLSKEDIAFNAKVFDKLSRNEVSALYVVINDEGYEIRLVADSFYYIPIDKDGHAEWVLLNFTTKSLDFVGLPKRAIRIDLDGNVVEFPFSGSGISFVRLSRQDEITTFYDNNTDDSLLSTLIVDDIDDVVHPLLGRIVDFSSYDITYSCSNGDVRKVYFNSDYTIKKRGLIEGVIYLGNNLTDFQKQANLAYVTAMKDLNNYDYSSGKKERVGVVVYYNGVFSNALAFDSSGVVILAGELELQSWTIDKEGNTTLIASTIIGGVDIDPSNFATLLEGFIPISRDFSDDFNNDFTR